jgi:protein-tyrosine phosphatase
MSKVEHRPYVAKRHPAWVDRIEYWSVHDLDRATADEALREIERNMLGLVESLRSR